MKQIGIGTMGIGLAASFRNPLFAGQAHAPKTMLPRSTPEEQGVSSAAISAFLDAVATSKVGFHSIMIVRHGHIIAEGWWAPYAAPLRHTLYSLSKSFTSSAVGLAVGEGRLTVEDTVVSLFPNDLPSEVSANLAAMKVKHLLTMSTGHGQDTLGPMRNATGKSWAKTFLEQPVEFEPGTHFLYNTGATYMQSAIVQKLTGQPLEQYLKPRLFDPLGIEGYDWEKDPQGINVGGYGLRVTTEHIARFGQLYLQKGMWNGKQILSPQWVEAATSKQVQSNPSNATNNNDESDWGQGYGYQFWRCRPGGFRGDGAFGQFSIVIPEKNIVIAATSESFDMQASMRLLWNHVLPGVKETRLPENSEEHKKLKEKLKSLTLGFPAGKATSPLAATVSGKEFALEANEFNVKSVSFRLSGSTCTLSVKDEKSENQLSFGFNSWLHDKRDKPAIPFSPMARPDIPTQLSGNASWSDDNTLLLTLRYIETAHGDQFICSFNENKLTLKFLNSVSMGNPNNPEKRLPISGLIIS